MRVLMIPTPVPAHLMPLVPLAWALRSAGHEVQVLGQRDVLSAVGAAGLTAVCTGGEFDVNGMLLRGLPGGQRPLQARPRPARSTLGGYGRVWTAHALAVTAPYLEFAREFRPDLILADPLEYASLIIGAVLEVPVVHHRWTVDAISGPARRASRPSLRELCRSLGVDELPDPTVLLDPTPPSLRLPESEEGTPIRWVPFSGTGQLPAGLREKKADRRVVVSLGNTLALHGVPFAGRLLHSFAGMAGAEILATVPEPQRRELGPVPEPVRLIDPLPLHLFLDTCDAMVHHGGAGTAMTATAFGLPQLVLPQLADHFAVGDRIAAAGAGLSFDEAGQQDDPQVVRGALEELLAEPRHGAAARRLAGEMRAMPAPAQVAADLEAIGEGRNQPCASRK
ncbi:nucleotide disphospho-sugar-binding domain-containing protein [Streptomyces sp. NPDC052396]|uniref:nucleotide disphospho-sugar-binding domain-containing protein n=1 Tax=Streptomyces sp. NPDC052396 TaxID=3365689 RepID=UPI0037CCD81F